jgi:hypothetical protein
VTRMADLPSIRSVLPWWHVGAALLCSVVAVLLTPVADVGLAPSLRIRGALRGRRARGA